MTRAWILVMACTACTFDPPAVPGDGAPMGDGGGGTDRDGDGIANGVDICPDVADPLQRDHDLDGHGDACDGCPSLPSATDPDQDRDGVGDDCDPAPATGGDARVLWLGFYPEDMAVIGDTARWDQFGAWSILDGWVRVTAGSNPVALRSTTAAQRAIVTSRIRLDDFPSNGAVGLVSGLVESGGSPPLAQFYQCVLFRSQTRINARSFAGGSQIQDSYTSWPGSVANGTILDVTARLGDMFECSFAAPVTTASATAGATPGVFELIAQGARVSFDYLFVVEPAR